MNDVFLAINQTMFSCLKTFCYLVVDKATLAALTGSVGVVT